MKQLLYIQRHTVSDDAGGMIVKHTARQRMQCKFAVIVFDRVPCVGSTLKTDDDVCILCKHVRDFSFSFIAPVCSNYCFNHSGTSYVLQICTPQFCLIFHGCTWKKQV